MKLIMFLIIFILLQPLPWDYNDFIFIAYRCPEYDYVIYDTYNNKVITGFSHESIKLRGSYFKGLIHNNIAVMFFYGPSIIVLKGHYSKIKNSFVIGYDFVADDIAWVIPFSGYLSPFAIQLIYNDYLVFTADNYYYCIDLNKGNLNFAIELDSNLGQLYANKSNIYIPDMKGRIYKHNISDGTIHKMNYSSYEGNGYTFAVPTKEGVGLMDNEGWLYRNNGEKNKVIGGHVRSVIAPNNSGAYYVIVGKNKKYEIVKFRDINIEGRENIGRLFGAYGYLQCVDDIYIWDVLGGVYSYKKGEFIYDALNNLSGSPSNHGITLIGVNRNGIFIVEDGEVKKVAGL